MKTIVKSITTMFFLFAFWSYGQAVEIKTIKGRSTCYHKTHPNSDSNTKKGISSTKITLQEATPSQIGVVAVDNKTVKEGDLVICLQTEKVYLAADTGSAVIKGTASKKMGRPNKPVLDFYQKKEILPEHFNEFIVLKYDGKKPFRNLFEKYQEKRLEPKYWLEKIDQIDQKEKKQNPEIAKLAKVLRKMEANRSS